MRVKRIIHKGRIAPREIFLIHCPFINFYQNVKETNVVKIVKFNEVTRESAKAAVATGMTPEDFVREAGLTTVTKLYAAIRGLYEKKAYAEKLIDGLKANRKKPLMDQQKKISEIELVDEKPSGTGAWVVFGIIAATLIFFSAK